MNIVQRGFSRFTLQRMACLAALAATQALAAQTMLPDASATQPILLSAGSPAMLWSDSAEAQQTAPPKSATTYYSRTGKSKAIPAKSDGPASPAPSRIEIMGAYSRWYPYSRVNGQPLFPLKDGGVVSGIYYLDRNIGFEVEGSYYEQTANDGQKGGAAGPVYRFILPRLTSLTIKAHGLIGGEKFDGPIIPSTAIGSFYANPPVWATTLTPGVSADLTIPKTRGHFALHAQADYQYIHASYGPAYAFNGGQVNLNTYRIVPGLVFRLGHAANGPTRSQKSNRY